MTVPPTLLDLLRAAATESPDRPIVHVRRDGSELRSCHAELLAIAERVAGGLLAAGVCPRNPVIVALDHSDTFLAAFWGALVAGAIPVPLAAEPERLRAVWSFLDRPPLLVETAIAERLPAWLNTSREAIRLFDIDHLLKAPPVATWFPATPDDLSYLQFSSGSTGQPKGVEITHGNVTANLRQILAAAPTSPEDVLVTWLPYFHDMGLVVTHLAPLAGQFAQVKMAPLHFARRPLAWLEVASRHRATILSTANFALALTLRLVKPDQLAGIELNSVRYMTVGSEPISPELCRRFTALLAPCGLRPTALTPAYGLAEATVGVTLAPVAEPVITRHVDRAKMAAVGKIVPTEPGPDAVELVDLGPPLPGCELRIVDEHDCPVANGTVGEVQVRGENVSRGYHRRGNHAALFCDNWLRTGDRGFLLDGRLTVTGRAKDVLFIHGRKFHAVDLEEVIGRIPGVRPGKVAVVGRQDRATGRERVAVFVATEASELAAALPVLREVTAAAQAAIGAPVDDLVLLPAGVFPHTTSGKLERYRLRDRLEAGEFDDRLRAVREQLAAPGETAAAVTPPRDELEAAVHHIWAEVLQRDPALFGVDDRFLALGGTSLQAMEVLSRMEALHGAGIEPATLLDRPTVADLATWLRDHKPVPSERPRPTAVERAASDEIAVVAMACRFSGAATPEQFWELLAAGRDMVTEVPATRWDAAALHDPSGERPDGSISRWGSFLADVAGFDSGFFGIDREEAIATDPQARLLLEIAAETLERAGYPTARRRDKRIGVFVGVGEVEYQELVLRLLAAGQPLHPATAVGNLRNLIAGRIANALDLTGPTVAIDTACSSALVALHLARQSLLAGECDLALVGAVNLNLTPTQYQLLSRARALSPTGRCRAFDDAADGIVPGEGAGMLLLSPRSFAEREGDPVLALVRGSAVNNDGRALSPMSPNPFRQQEVIAEAYRASGIDPATVAFIEAHGTGTAIGDPIELRSLAHVFPSSGDGGSRWLGAVKTNLGHLLNAAGMPGLLKAILTLQHRQIPPTLHYERPNRRFDLASAGFAINSALEPWPSDGPRRAGVNAFGFGGTNAHVILEEAPPVQVADEDAAGRPHLLLLSARSEAALDQTLRDLAAWPEAAADPAALWFSASTGRDPHAHRLAAVVDGAPTAALAAISAGQPEATAWRARVGRSHRPRIALLCSGQGAQYPGQGKRLADHDPIFRAALEEASTLAGAIRGKTLLEWCWSPEVTRQQLAETDVAQPLLVAFSVALGRMLQRWGIEPDAVAGHSVGELAAACLAGSLTFDDAIGIAVSRGRLMAELPTPGTMAAVFAPAAVVRAELDRHHRARELAIAAINDPAQTVIAGSEEAVKALCAALDRQGYRSIPLAVSHAFHSPLMTPMLGAFGGFLLGLPPAAPPRTRFLSTVTTDWIDGEAAALDSDYWLDHVVKPVRFADAVSKLAAEGIDTFVEIGPGSSLVGMVRNTLRERAGEFAVESLLQRGEDDLRAAFGALGRLWLHGVEFDRRALEGGRLPRRVPVPTYPFERQRHWLPEPSRRTLPAADPDEHRPDPIDRLFYRPVWIDTPLPTDSPLPGRWLIVDHARAPAIVAGFADAGIPAGIVRADEVAGVLGGDDPVAGILIASGLGPVGARLSLEATDRWMREELDRLLAVAHAIAAAPVERRPRRLLVAGSHAYLTGNHDRVSAPERAVPLAFTAALGDELPGTAVLALDVDWRDGQEAATARLAAEVRAGETAGIAAWRGSRRLTRALRKGAERTAPIAIRSGGIYLITGGAEGIGAELARALIERGASDLVLIGRTPLARAPRRQALLAELGQSGAHVGYEQGDIGDPAWVEDLIARLADRSDLAGVIHAAGVADPGFAADKTGERIARVLAPKTRGLLALELALERHRQRPDFVIACSSFSAALPGLGGMLTDYVAANAFLDAYAASRCAAGAPWLALAWSAWAETGMGANAGLHELLAAKGFPPLSTHDGVCAFTRALDLGVRGQVAVIDFAPSLQGHISGFDGYVASDPPAHVLAVSSPERGSITEHAISIPSGAASSRRPLAGDLEARLQAMVAVALGVAPAEVDLERSFMALGLQSLVAVDLVKQLERQTGEPLPTTLFFEYPTIRALARHLDEHLPREPASPNDTAAHLLAANGVASHRHAPKPTAIPLTPVQRAFYVTSRLYPETPTLSLLRETVAGELDAELLVRALGLLIERHPMLRAHVVVGSVANAKPHLEIAAGEDVIAARNRWFVERAGAVDLATLESEIANSLFDLASAPLFRVILHRELSDRGHLFLLAHHLVCDAWSLALLSDELWTVYADLAAGRQPLLPATGASFADYVVAERTESAGPEADAHRAWWAERLPGIADIADLPLSFDGDGEGAQIHALTHLLSRDETAALKRLAADVGVTLADLLLALYARALARRSGRKDLVLSVAHAGRTLRLPGIERLIGTCADVLPIPLHVDTDEPVAAIAERAHAVWLDTQRHARISSVELARMAGRGRGAGPRVLSHAAFSFASLPGDRVEGGSLRVEEISGRTGTAATRLTLLGWDANGRIGLSWNYAASLIREQTVAALADAFLDDLRAHISPDGAPPARHEATKAPAVTDEPAPVRFALDMVRATCERLADKPAIEFDRRVLTYAELLAQSEQLAAALIAAGAKRNRAVALLTYRGFEAVTGILGAMGAGAPWLSLDADAPLVRLLQQLDTADAELLVYETRTAEVAARLADALGDRLRLVSASSLPSIRPADFAPVAVQADDIAYVIFTSGSTGVPKGVPITHGSFATYIGWINAIHPVGAADRAAANSAVFFDASAHHLVTPLVLGATICVVPEALMRDPDGLLDFIERERVSVWRGVPSVWERMLTSIERRIARGEPQPPLADLRVFELGGEAMFAGTVRRWMALYGDRQTIINDYGPAEATIAMTSYEVPGRPAEHITRIPIGKPIGSVAVAVLDEERRPVAPGAIGELYIAGPILSPGYLNDPKLTAQYFVEIDGRRMYRTRDLVIQHPDGVLEFVGRSDDQVKIGGMRIELGDVEAALAGFPGVARAAAVKIGSAPGAEQLVAFLAIDGPAPSVMSLRAWLAERIPAYMIPRRFVQIARLPLTATGKVNRRTLAEMPLDPATLLTDEPTTAQATPTERIVAGVWESVLGVPRIGPGDDFFALGGDSLRMLDVLVQLEGRVPFVPRAVAFYQNPTLSAFAAEIDRAAADPELAEMPISSDGERFPVTPTQAGFILTEALNPGIAQNWCSRLILEGPLDLAAFRRAADALIARHSMLRTVFPAGLRPPQQEELPPVRPISIPHEDLSSLPAGKQEAALAERLQSERATPFAIDRWPLFRMRLIKLAPDRHAWLIAAHHLIGDGMSAWVLGQDLLRLYDRLFAGQEPNLPPLRSTFRDYVELTERAAKLPRTQAVAHWLSVFAEPYELPTAWRAREPTATGRTLHHWVELDPAVLARLKQEASARRLTLFPLVLTAYVRQLARWTRRDDLVIGTALSGRDHPLPDITHVVGCFATGVPLRLHEPDALDRIDPEVAAGVFVNALQHALPPARIAHALPEGARPEVAIGSQFFFTFVDTSAYGELASDSLAVRWDESGALYDPPLAGVDLVVAAQPSERGLRLAFEAASSAFTAAGIGDFADGVARELRRLAGLGPDGADATPAIRFTDRPLDVAATVPPVAALIGYLPPLADIAGLLDGGLPLDGLREFVRAAIFPDGRPRWLNAVDTSLGRSAFIGIPWFADELTPSASDRLAAAVAEAVAYAGSLGAKSVSLAGMIPSLTGYGYAIAQRLNGASGVELTTGHATTVVSVVTALAGALAATDRDLAESDLAVVGLGSIGRASLELLLDRFPQPRRLILCDAPGSAIRLHELAADLRKRGFRGQVDIAEATPAAPAAVYEASLIVGATSAPNVIDIDRLQPGTLLIDDSFPPSFDPARALARMRERADVLLIGGGAIRIGETSRVVYVPPAGEPFRERIAARLPHGEIASCQLESLLRAHDPSLPLTRGLVTLAGARAYWAAIERAGFTPGAWQLGDQPIDRSVADAIRILTANRHPVR